MLWKCSVFKGCEFPRVLALGKEVLPVLFEEMAGVWLSMQDGRHQKMKKQEMKVFTMYEEET